MCVCVGIYIIIYMYPLMNPSATKSYETGMCSQYFIPLIQRQIKYFLAKIMCNNKYLFIYLFLHF